VIDDLWDRLIASRTPSLSTGVRNTADQNPVPGNVPAPGQTVYDNTSGTGDRPFMPFGVAMSGPGGSLAFPNGSGIDDTILRRDPNTGLPLIWVAGQNGLAGQVHPYLQSEAARKALNQLTTVSHTFGVWLTVGYFEVKFEQDQAGAHNNNPTAGYNNWPDTVPSAGLLGKEVYKEVPGDLRQKFFAIVDRSNLMPITTGTTATIPFFATLEGNVAAGQDTTTMPLQIATPYDNGTALSIQPN